MERYEMTCIKEKGVLIFTKEDNTCATFDLRDHSRALNGHPTEMYSNFFTNFTFPNVIFKESHLKEFFENIARTAGGSRLRNMRSMISYLPEYAHTEAYFMNNCPVYGKRDSPWVALPKSVKKLLPLVKTGYRTTAIKTYIYNREFFNGIAPQIMQLDNRAEFLNLFDVDRFKGIWEISQQYKIKFSNLIEGLIYYIKYEGMNDWNAISDLRDYNRMASTMGKSYKKLPSHLRSIHDITTINFNLNKKEYQAGMFKNIYKGQFTHEGKKFTIMEPKTPEGIIQEGIDNNNCVGSYVESVAEGRCVILQMRDIHDISTGLITLEYSPSNNKIIQALRTGNTCITSEHARYLKLYCKEKHFDLADKYIDMAKRVA